MWMRLDDVPSRRSHVVSAIETIIKAHIVLIFLLLFSHPIGANIAQAENARLSLRARLDMEQAQRRGDLYLRWGLLGAGIELDGGKRTWHLSGARDWYDSRPRVLPEAKPAP